METIAIVASWALLVIVFTVTVLSLTAAVRAYLQEPAEKNNETPGRWEAIYYADVKMVRVRWSCPDQHGRYFWVAHYPGTHWGGNAAARDARRLNEENKLPWEYHAYHREQQR